MNKKADFCSGVAPCVRSFTRERIGTCEGPVRTKANGATRPRWPGGSAAAVLRMRCPICLDEVPLTVLAGCSHAACQPCLGGGVGVARAGLQVGGGGDSHEH